jgi:hypothetical protein
MPHAITPDGYERTDHSRRVYWLMVLVAVAVAVAVAVPVAVAALKN